mmetsp:Transcript_8898/g.22787  ORF Transcript_8898/g.22787 Transcript_8898/m.22787 type:complete len:209 (+) Transcript_8898:889-1515(+)
MTECTHSVSPASKPSSAAVGATVRIEMKPGDSRIALCISFCQISYASRHSQRTWWWTPIEIVPCSFALVPKSSLDTCRMICSVLVATLLRYVRVSPRERPARELVASSISSEPIWPSSSAACVRRRASSRASARLRRRRSAAGGGAGGGGLKQPQPTFRHEQTLDAATRKQLEHPWPLWTVITIGGCFSHSASDKLPSGSAMSSSEKA